MRINDKHRQFTGTTTYYKWSPLHRNILLTDGAMYIAQEYQAYWLMDAIASHIPSVDDHFAVVLLENTSDNHFTLSIQDDIPMNRQFAKQDIEYSDFPPEGIQLYIQQSDDFWVIFLPSEY